MVQQGSWSGLIGKTFAASKRSTIGLGSLDILICAGQSRNVQSTIRVDVHLLQQEKEYMKIYWDWDNIGVGSHDE